MQEAFGVARSARSQWLKLYAEHGRKALKTASAGRFQVRSLTVLMWLSKTFEMACASSVFSLAMMVKLLISYLLLI